MESLGHRFIFVDGLEHLRFDRPGFCVIDFKETVEKCSDEFIRNLVRIGSGYAKRLLALAFIRFLLPARIESVPTSVIVVLTRFPVIYKDDFERLYYQGHLFCLSDPKKCSIRPKQIPLKHGNQDEIDHFLNFVRKLVGSFRVFSNDIVTIVTIRDPFYHVARNLTSILYTRKKVQYSGLPGVLVEHSGIEYILPQGECVAYPSNCSSQGEQIPTNLAELFMMEDHGLRLKWVSRLNFYMNKLKIIIAEKLHTIPSQIFPYVKYPDPKGILCLYFCPLSQKKSGTHSLEDVIEDLASFNSKILVKYVNYQTDFKKLKKIWSDPETGLINYSFD